MRDHKSLKESAERKEVEVEKLTLTGHFFFFLMRE